MYPKLFIVSILMMAVTGCRSKTAFNYSQKIVAINASLSPDITTTEEKVGRYLTNGHYDSMKTVSAQMEYKVDRAMKEFREMKAPDVEEAEHFKDSFLRYLSILKDIYVSYSAYVNDTTMEGRERISRQMIDINRQKDRVIADMQEAQRKFARANGFRLSEEN